MAACLDKVSTGSDSDLVPRRLEVFKVTRSLSLPVLTLSNTKTDFGSWKAII